MSAYGQIILQYEVNLILFILKMLSILKLNLSLRLLSISSQVHQFIFKYHFILRN